MNDAERLAVTHTHAEGPQHETLSLIKHTIEDDGMGAAEVEQLW